MKNSVIKFSSLLVMITIFMVVSAQAQLTARYQAKIPFNFKIGKTTFKAGNYIINLSSRNQLAMILSVKNVENRNVKDMVVLINGSRSLTNNSVLMFDRFGDKYALKQIVSPDFGLSAPKSKTKYRIARKSEKSEESVAVLLIKEIGKTE